MTLYLLPLLFIREFELCKLPYHHTYCGDKTEYAKHDGVSDPFLLMLHLVNRLDFFLPQKVDFLVEGIEGNDG